MTTLLTGCCVVDAYCAKHAQPGLQASLPPSGAVIAVALCLVTASSLQT